MFNQSFGGAGAGFTNSPAEDKRSSTRRGEPLIPVTCATIQNLLNMEDKITFGHREFTQVIVMGKVMEVNKQPTINEYKIQDDENDPKSVLTVRHYVSDDKDSEFMEDTWIKVFGKIRTFQDQRSLTAFGIQNVESEAEKELHMVETRYAKLFYEKDLLDKLNDEKNSGISRGVGHIFSPGSSGGDATAPPPPKVLKQEQGSVPMQNAAGLEGIKALVAEIVRSNDSPDNDQGVHISTIKERLPPGTPANTLKSAIDYCVNEGHIYSTVDDSYYKVC